MGHGPGDPLYYRELFFEEVRAAVAPSKPSRLRSFFGLRTSEDLSRYQQEQQGTPYGYRVSVADTATMARLDLEIFNRHPFMRGHTASRELAEQYWTSEGGTFLEVLVSEPVEVLERFSA